MLFPLWCAHDNRLYLCIFLHQQCWRACNQRTAGARAALKHDSADTRLDFGRPTRFRLLHRRYWDATALECKTFTYGGCQGNANRFDTRSECEAACKVASEANAVRHLMLTASGYRPQPATTASSSSLVQPIACCCAQQAAQQNMLAGADSRLQQ